jgi:GAF domain-containing protein
MGSSGPNYCCPQIRQNKLQMSATSGLVTELERIATALNADDGSASQFSLASVAEKIAKTLSVRKDEVAIMGVSTRWRHLHFLVPEALKNVGFIPLSSNSALAARTARDSRPEIDNDFIVARHATVFEGVKINSETPESIQKMLSAPILSEGKVIGVIQISRKGPSAAGAGPDFTADDLGKILALCKPLGKLLRRITGE